MDLKQVKSVIELLESSEVDEIEISTETLKIRVARHPRHSHHAPEHLPPKITQTTSQDKNLGIDIELEKASTHARSVNPEPLEPAQTKPPPCHLIRSPIVGTFYEAPSPDSQPFVQVGSQVKKGEVLCVIEAMKMMNSIESDRDGMIKEILIENGEAIEFNQPLFSIY